jgi:hypothetical protein
LTVVTCSQTMQPVNINQFYKLLTEALYENDHSSSLSTDYLPR